MNEASMQYTPPEDGDGEWPVPTPAETPAILVSYRTRRSSSFGKIALAMSKAQGAMTGALKDADNPFFKSKYADLGSVWDDCRTPLSMNEIAVFQMPSSRGDIVTVTTLLAHSSDQWIESELDMKSKDASPQGIGSAITYARRYALAAMAGVYQVDDDAEAAHGRGKPAQKEPSTSAKLLASTFKASLKGGDDKKIAEVHRKANADDQALYAEAWWLLTAPERREIKAAIEREKVPNTNRASREPEPA
jgi:hypothetical protein